MTDWTLVVFNDGSQSPQGTRWIITSLKEDGTPAPRWRFPGSESLSSGTAYLYHAVEIQTGWESDHPDQGCKVGFLKLDAIEYQPDDTEIIKVRSAIWEDGTMMDCAQAKTRDELESMDQDGTLEPGHFDAVKELIGASWGPPGDDDES